MYRQSIFGIMLLIFTCSVSADYRTETLVLKDARLHLTHWSAKQQQQADDSHAKDTVILLSGPTDNWNSDSAWFARLAPLLAQQFNVITIDRAGQVFADSNAQLGYIAFGRDLLAAVQELKLNNLHFVAFASSNISLLKFSDLNRKLPVSEQIKIKKIILIDPDVLTPSAIERYSRDAEPFRTNIESYTDYILQGKYNQRAKEKNLAELNHLKQLAGNDSKTNWRYIELLFSKRLELNNLVNLFTEVAGYNEDLTQAAKLSFSKATPLTVFDTDFEMSYIKNAKDEKEKQGLLDWKAQAEIYYAALVNHSEKGKYIKLKTQEHLLPFSQPQLIVKALQQ